MALGFPRHCLLQNQMWYKIANPLISSRGSDLLQAQPNHPNPSHDQHRFWIYSGYVFRIPLILLKTYSKLLKYLVGISTRQEKSPSLFYFWTPGNSSNSFRAAAVLVAHSMTSNSNQQKPACRREVKMLCYDSAKLVPSRELTNTTYGKGHSSSQPTWEGKCQFPGVQVFLSEKSVLIFCIVQCPKNQKHKALRQQILLRDTILESIPGGMEGHGSIFDNINSRQEGRIQIILYPTYAPMQTALTQLTTNLRTIQFMYP